MAITEWLVKGINKGFILGPFTKKLLPPHLNDIHCSPVFAVDKPVGYRPIHHLSYPRNKKGCQSVNDLIDDKFKHVQYTTFKQVVALARAVGVGGYLWVVDAKDAYYRVPVKKKYYKYFGIEWLGRTFVFTSLQMGLASACQIYTKFADAVLYIIVQSRFGAFYDYVQNILWVRHYLHDFFGGHKSKEIATA